MKKILLFAGLLALVQIVSAQNVTVGAPTLPSGESVSETQSHASLQGKIIHVFGDSYVRNHRKPFEEAWHYKVAARLGMVYNNYGRNGSCIAFDRTGDGFGPSMLIRYREMDPKADYVLVIAGHNDACKIGLSVDSLVMFRDSLDLFCSLLQEKYPTAKIGFVTPWDVPRDGFAQVNGVIRRVCAEHHIPVLDAARTSGIAVGDPEFRKKYFQSPKDTAHLNAAGHDLLLDWGEAFIRSL